MQKSPEIKPAEGRTLHRDIHPKPFVHVVSNFFPRFEFFLSIIRLIIIPQIDQLAILFTTLFCTHQAAMDSDQMPSDSNESNNELPMTPYNTEVSSELDEVVDQEPAFLDMEDAIEVIVDEENVPMEEEEDEEVPEVAKTLADVVDMSTVKLESHTGPVYSVAAHYDTTSKSLSILTGGGDDKSFLHRMISGGAPSTLPLAHVHTDTVSCCAFNIDFIGDTNTPKLAAVGGYDGAIVLYDAESGSKFKELEGPSDVEWLSFHPKGGSVLLAGSMSDGTIWMYHIPTSKCLQVFVGHESGVTAGSFTPDGRWAVSASSDGTVRVWAPRTGVSKHTFRLGDAGLTSLAVNGGSDSQLVIVGAEDGMAHVCHVGTKKVVASLRHFEPPSNTQHDDDEEMELPMSVEAVGFATVNPNWCATGGVDGVLKIWDLSNDGTCRQACRRPDVAASNAGGITRLKWHPTLPLLFASYSDGDVRLWDARNGTVLRTLTGHLDVINDLDIVYVDPTGGTAVIVSGSDDKTARIYEIDIHAALQSAQANVN
jgi:ribosome assembly protein SQT1